MEVDEEVFEPLLGDADPSVSHADLQVDVVHLAVVRHRLVVIIQELVLLLTELALRNVLLGCVVSLAEVLRLLGRLANRLVVQNAKGDCDATVLVGELQRVRNEVQQDLQVAPLVAVDGVDHVQGGVAVDLGLQHDARLIGGEKHHLECFEDNLAQAEILLSKLE